MGIYTLLARMPGGLVLDTHDHLVVHRRDPPLLILHCGTDYAYIRHPIPTLLDPVQLVHRLISLGHLWRVPAGLGFLPRCQATVRRTALCHLPRGIVVCGGRALHGRQHVEQQEEGVQEESHGRGRQGQVRARAEHARTRKWGRCGCTTLL